MKNAWVLGGTGFIGSRVSQHLISLPSYRVNLLMHRFKAAPWLEKANVLTGSLEAFDAAWLDRFSPDEIYHLARIAGDTPTKRAKASERAFAANTRLIKLLKERAFQGPLAYMSGSLMYGNLPQGELATESSLLKPVAYGAFYQKGEQPFVDESKRGDLDVRMLRPGWITGPDSWFKFFYWMHMKAHNEVLLIGNPKREMSFIHVEDGAALATHWNQVGKPGQGLNLFCGAPIAQEEFCGILADLWNVPIKRLSDQEVINRFGRTEWEALSSSSPLGTEHPEAYANFDFKYPTVAAIVEAASLALENEERVFSTAP